MTAHIKIFPLRPAMANYVGTVLQVHAQTGLSYKTTKEWVLKNIPKQLQPQVWKLFIEEAQAIHNS